MPWKHHNTQKAKAVKHVKHKKTAHRKAVTRHRAKKITAVSSGD